MIEQVQVWLASFPGSTPKAGGWSLGTRLGLVSMEAENTSTCTCSIRIESGNETQYHWLWTGLRLTINDKVGNNTEPGNGRMRIENETA